MIGGGTGRHVAFVGCARRRRLENDRAALDAFLEELSLWVLAPRCMVATQAGTLREAKGMTARCSICRKSRGAVAVVDAPRVGWDAGALARGYNADPLAAHAVFVRARRDPSPGDSPTNR